MNFVNVCVTHGRAHHIRLKCGIGFPKFAIFVGLYFLLSTTFRHQTLRISSPNNFPNFTVVLFLAVMKDFVDISGPLIKI